MCARFERAVSRGCILVGSDDVACRGIGITRRRVHHDKIAPLNDIRAHKGAGLL
jgi:hypothetical protein